MNPPIPPRPDYSSPKEGAPPPTPERTSSQNAGHAHSRVSGNRRSDRSDRSERSGSNAKEFKEPPLPPPPPISKEPGPDPDWEAREEVRQQELTEARARAAQMEKTMRWWSDCTANWREKWSKVRNERNKARDECRHLRGKIEHYAKKVEDLKRDKAGLSNELVKMKGKSDDKSVCSSSGSHKSDECDKSEEADFVSKLLSCSKDTPSDSAEGMAQLRLRLEEAHKTSVAESKERSRMAETLKQMEAELKALKEQNKEMHLNGKQADEEAMGDAERGERRIAELRKELENLQAENASEWAKREKLETEKIALERDNKRLRSELKTAEEEIEEQRKRPLASDGDLKVVQADLQARCKELSDVRHAYSKQKKIIAEMTGELDHARSRAEQYEAEVKKVRGRVEELKQDLATAEDEVDQQSHQARKIQRTNEELQQQVEGLQVQIQHMTTRLRRSSNPLLNSRASSLKSFDGLIDSDVEAGSHEAS